MIYCLYMIVSFGDVQKICMCYWYYQRGIGGTRDSTPTVFFLFVLLALGAFSCIYWMALYIREMFDEFDLRSTLNLLCTVILW